MIFIARCPSGHPAVQENTPERLMRLLESGALMFRCGVCEAQWAADAGSVQEMKARLLQPHPAVWFG